MNTDQLIARTVVNRIAEARSLCRPWDCEDVALPDWLAAADVSGWAVAELGEMRERLAAKEERETGGLWYTPPQLAEWMAGFTLARQPCCDLPGCALRVMALDPACGAGVFLLAAARQIARVYAEVATGRDEPPAWAVQTVLPVVMSECVFGIDTDPVAVDLAKSVLWLEVGGTRPITWMDDNIICGDALAGDSPKTLECRLDDPDPLIILGNPPYRENAKGAAPWIEARRTSGGEEMFPRPSLDEFRASGRSDGKLSNLWTFFWRWAAWKALEARDAAGAVAFITPKPYLTSHVYAGMREHLRRVASEAWIVDLSPEGHQSPVKTRFFPTVKTPLCVGIFAKGAASPTPAVA